MSSQLSLALVSATVVCQCCRRSKPAGEFFGTKCASCAGKAPRSKRGHTGNPEGGAHPPRRDPARAEERAREYAEQLEREGWPAHDALRRAREAYGLAVYRPGGIVSLPRLPDAYRRELREECATARPGAGGVDCAGVAA